MKTLIPWQRATEFMEPLRHEMDDLFLRFFGSNGEGRLAAWSPNVDVEETDKEIVVKADLPGVEAKDIDVSFADGSLVLKGEKKTEKEEKKKDYHRVERFFGQFYRSIPLPSGAEVNNITASMAKGVVTLTIPKKAEAQPKKITVKATD